MAHGNRYPLKSIIFLSSYIKSNLQEGHQNLLWNQLELQKKPRIQFNVFLIWDLIFEFGLFYLKIKTLISKTQVLKSKNFLRNTPKRFDNLPMLI